MTPRLLLLALAVAAGVSACGKRGDLDQPPPLFGERARAEYEAQQRARAAAQRETTQAEADEEDSRAPVPDPDDRFEPARRNVPATREPIDGVNDPVGSRPNTEQTTRRPGGSGPR